MREFDTGATRDSDEDKLDYEGFLSPLVLQRFAEYMHEHRIQPDGALRASDNWQKGIPRDAYMKSAFRHFMDWWLEHRGHASRESLEEALCGLMFNVCGYLHEVLGERRKTMDEATILAFIAAPIFARRTGPGRNRLALALEDAQKLRAAAVDLLEDLL